MPKQLTPQTATITTAAVQVKTLTISGKQVTLAVFRQLRKEPLIADDGTLNGVPWGTVNYCPDRKVWDPQKEEIVTCSDNPHHLHVVWQKGNELRRSRVVKPAWWRQRFYSEAAGAFIQGVYCSGAHTLSDWAYRTQHQGAQETHFSFNNMPCAADQPDYHQRSEECFTVAELDEARSALADEIRGERERRARHNAQWTALAELPQLFIAV